jgi:pimeloyl-ACP methyl ester carboxylesterase
VFSAPGQDGNDGEYCMGTYLTAARSCLDALRRNCHPSALILFGSCAGGTIAAHLATERPANETMLVLWESMFHYTDMDVQALIDRMSETGEVIMASGIRDVIHLSSVVERISCPTLLAFGPQQLPMRPGCHQTDVQRIVQGLTTPRHLVEEIFVPSANHGVTRGGAPLLLNELLTCVLSFTERQLRHQKAGSQ